MARQVYIRAKSKADINRALPASVWWTEYTMSGDNHGRLADLEPGSLVKVYEKTINGSPYAKAYGKWNGKKVT